MEPDDSPLTERMHHAQGTKKACEDISAPDNLLTNAHGPTHEKTNQQRGCHHAVQTQDKFVSSPSLSLPPFVYLSVCLYVPLFPSLPNSPPLLTHTTVTGQHAASRPPSACSEPKSCSVAMSPITKVTAALSPAA